MSRWIDNSTEERLMILTAVRGKTNLPLAAIEKDWWVSMILKALFSLPTAPFMYFKGGTSLSKAWKIIDRFSEDIDLSLYRDFFLEECGLSYAKCSNNNQIKYLRKASRDYVTVTLRDNLENALINMGLEGVTVEAVNEHMTADGPKPIDHDRDPSVLLVYYPSVVDVNIGYLHPYVKVEISCLSMKEPFEVRRIGSLVEEAFPTEDSDSVSDIPTISPARTFLEKMFLLNEEFQRNNPRSNRMSRHLYDLERLMTMGFDKFALSDQTLYYEIVEHRRKFYHVGGVDYDLNYPDKISFCPTGELRARYATDYETMKSSMIYGEKIEFDELMKRLLKLQSGIHNINR